MSIVSKPDHGSHIVESGLPTERFQVFLDDIERMLNDSLLGNQVQLKSFTVTTLPSAATAGGLIYVSNETGGAVPAFSDGTNWRRVTDRAVVS